MSDGIDDSRKRNHTTAPAFRVALALSLLVHAVALWQWQPRVRSPSSDMAERGDASPPLVVQLVPRSRPTPAPRLPPALQEERPPTPQARPPTAPRPRPTPPVIVQKEPGPSLPSAPPKAPPAAARVPPDSDLASYIEARRRARGESAPTAVADSASNAPRAEDDAARANRIAAANLGLGRKPTFGPEKRGGGIFHVQRMSYDYAEFLFYGWNKDIRRNTVQTIEVRKGGHSDIRIAVVRRMIAVIREHEQGDFVWESQRLGVNVTLSARTRDNAGLEDFMMREFF